MSPHRHRLADGARRGLVVGKFLPPHAGHHHVIDRALAGCAQVDVVVCDRDGQVPEASVRAAWLAEIHPGATLTVVPDICGWHADDPCPPACSARWAEHLGGLGLGPWDEVYGSEAYVERFAPLVGATAVLVDADRDVHPVSGTAIRRDLAARWPDLHPVVRAGLTRRVVVVGAESTGTTTLASDLADRLGAPWVPEHGRRYSEERAKAAGSIWDVRWTSADFHRIADCQERTEADTIQPFVADPVRSAPGPLGPLTVCDTDVLATAVWHRRYCGDLADDLLDRARRRPPLVYALTTPAGVPFEQDGLRDGEHVREDMTGWFRHVLAGAGVPWIEVSGPPDVRVGQVLARLEELTAAHPLFVSGR